LLTLFKIRVNPGSDKVEKEVKRLYNDVMTLKMAIEEAIIKGQKSLPDLKDIAEPRRASNEGFALARTNTSSSIVSGLNDF